MHLRGMLLFVNRQIVDHFSANPQPFTSLAATSVPYAPSLLLDELSADEESNSAIGESGSGSVSPVESEDEQDDVEQSSSTQSSDSDDAGEWNARPAKKLKKA